MAGRHPLGRQPGQLRDGLAWVKTKVIEIKLLKILVKVVDVILLCFLTVVVCSNLKDYINALRTIKGNDLKVTFFGHVVLILVLLTELALAVFSQKIPRKPFLIIGLVCIALTLIGLITPIAFGPGNLPLNFLALVLLAVSRFLQENVAQKRML
ncbi:hypothetical protein ACXO2W_06280 [Lactobacillus delbrueckii subsp. bulgaricus]